MKYKGKKAYLAGPMRGLPAEVVAEQFTSGARQLRKLGLIVFSPFENDQELGFDYERGTLVSAEDSFTRMALLKDITFILSEAEFIFLLPGWENSRGVAAEAGVAYAVDSIDVIKPEFWFDKFEPSVDGRDLLV